MHTARAAGSRCSPGQVCAVHTARAAGSRCSPPPPTSSVARERVQGAHVHVYTPPRHVCACRTQPTTPRTQRAPAFLYLTTPATQARDIPVGHGGGIHRLVQNGEAVRGRGVHICWRRPIRGCVAGQRKAWPGETHITRTQTSPHPHPLTTTRPPTHAPTHPRTRPSRRLRRAASTITHARTRALRAQRWARGWAPLATRTSTAGAHARRETAQHTFSSQPRVVPAHNIGTPAHWLKPHAPLANREKCRAPPPPRSPNDFQGKYSQSDGTVFTGTWSHGRKHGRFTFTFPGGDQ